MGLVDFCIDGKHAIEVLKNTYESGGSYKLIILDFSMPRISGPEASKEIDEYLFSQKLKPNQEFPKIFGLSAHSIQQSEKEGKEAGMQKVFEKSLKLKTLAKLLNNDYYN